MLTVTTLHNTLVALKDIDYDLNTQTALLSRSCLPPVSRGGAPCGRPGGPSAAPLAVGVLCAAPARRLELFSPGLRAPRGENPQICTVLCYCGMGSSSKVGFSFSHPSFLPVPISGTPARF